MARLQNITRQLQGIGSEIFPELCEMYFIRTIRDYADFFPIGRHLNKQKNTRGTPDILFKMPSGNYIFIEVTTDESNKQKLNNDIISCFDKKKHNIPFDDIGQIILCFNFIIDKKKKKELTDLAKSYKKDVNLTFLGLERLSVELHTHHKTLVEEYLNLSIGTGQIISINQFIKEYNKTTKTGFSTPLNNTFYPRKDKQEELVRLLKDTDFLIVKGSAGTGKTRLVVETLKALQNQYEVFCISDKHSNLLKDLFNIIDNKSNTILFVDDANRIERLQQIIGYYKSVPEGVLKIVMTVRGYAYKYIKKVCEDFLTKTIDIPSFSREELIALIQAPPFEIKNSQFQDRIIKIAKGNPRLAIMVALLAREKEDLKALNSVEQVFDKYFTTFSKDKPELFNAPYIKSLGLIAFFNILPYKDYEKIRPILEDFGLDYKDFINILEKLEEYEIVERAYEFVRITEQNISNYFFYKGFIKDEVLSFQTLLFSYFFKNQHRVTDCILPINNFFDAQKVMTVVKPSVILLFNEVIKHQQKNAFAVLYSFWFYLKDEIFELAYDEILPLPISNEFNYKIEKENTYYNEDRFIKLIGHFLECLPDISEPFEFLFEYIKRRPNLFSEFINKIINVLSYSEEDMKNGFVRQWYLLTFLQNKIRKKDMLAQHTLFEITKHFTKHKYSIKQPKIVIPQSLRGTIPTHSYNIHEVRQLMWLALSEISLNDFSDRLMKLLEAYGDGFNYYTTDLILFDFPFIMSLIDKNIKPAQFKNCLFVQQLFERLQWQEIELKDIQIEKYQSLYAHSSWELYKKIRWNILTREEEKALVNDTDYEKIREDNIRKNFVFQTKAAIEDFFIKYVEIYSIVKIDYAEINTLSIIIDENLKHNFQLGLELFVLIISSDKVKYFPSNFLKKHLNEKDKAQIILNKIQKKALNIEYWRWLYYQNLNKSLVNLSDCNIIIQTVKNIKRSLYIHDLKDLKKYQELDNTFYKNLFETILKRQIQHKGSISLGTRSYREILKSEQVGINLITSIYLQEASLEKNFDYSQEILQELIKQEPSIFLRFLEIIISNSELRSNYKHKVFNFIWNIPNYEEQLAILFDLCVQKIYYIDKSICNVFFKQLDENSNKKALSFLKTYVSNNAHDTKRMNLIVDVLQNSKKDWFNDILIIYLYQNDRIDDFKDIEWISTFFFGSAETNVAELRANQWQGILNIINQSIFGVQYLPIKKWIRNRIKMYLKGAERERLERFLRY